MCKPLQLWTKVFTTSLVTCTLQEWHMYNAIMSSHSILKGMPTELWARWHAYQMHCWRGQSIHRLDSLQIRRFTG